MERKVPTDMLASNPQVSNRTKKECVENVVKSVSYLEGEAKSPFYRRA